MITKSRDRSHTHTHENHREKRWIFPNYNKIDATSETKNRRFAIFWRASFHPVWVSLDFSTGLSEFGRFLSVPMHALLLTTSWLLQCITFSTPHSVFHFLQPFACFLSLQSQCTVSISPYSCSLKFPLKPFGSYLLSWSGRRCSAQT